MGSWRGQSERLNRGGLRCQALAGLGENETGGAAREEVAGCMGGVGGSIGISYVRLGNHGYLFSAFAWHGNSLMQA